MRTTFSPTATAVLLVLLAFPAVGGESYALWAPGKPVPNAAECPLLDDVEFVVIKSREPDADGYNWLHGVAVCWHKGRLYASFGHNKGHENTATEEARGRISNDGGKAWGKVFTMDPGEDSLAISHGVFLSHEGKLYVAYSNCGGRGANRKSAELAIIPVEKLAAE